jgi:hypothetical protein
MSQITAQSRPQVSEREWVTFPGGELEARRSRALCPGCRAALQHAVMEPHASVKRPLCVECYRAGLNRARALKAAGQLDTASVERFQDALPFEAVNVPRLEALKVERRAARVELTRGTHGCVDKRRQAQIAARHALQQIAAGLRARQLAPSDRERVIASAIHAAELQLPESWMPFVVSR